MANKKGLFHELKDEIFDIYGKENVIPILCKGLAIGIIYILWEIAKLETKALPEPPSNDARN